MSFIRDAFDRVWEWSREGCEPKELFPELGNPHKRLLAMPNGVTIHREEIGPPPLFVATDSVGDLVLLLQNRVDADGMWNVGIGVDTCSVVAVLDSQVEQWKRHKAFCLLKLSKAYLRIRNISGRTTFDQRGLIDWFRNEIGVRATYCTLDPPTLLGHIREIKFRRNDSSESRVQSGKESIAREALAEVAGIDLGTFPETFHVCLPMFDRSADPISTRVSIAMNLTVNVAEQEFHLQPAPGAIEDAEATVVGSIVDHLRDTLPGALVFRGTVDPRK